MTAREHAERISGFNEQITQACAAGYRFLFFAGAGLSKPAGYPVLSELEQSYLPFCLARALGLDPFATRPRKDGTYARWTPRSGTWPDMAAESSMRSSADHDRAPKRVTAKQVGDLLKAADLLEPGTLDFDSFVLVRAQEALGSWHACLAFLSQLVDSDDGRGARRISLGLPDSAVVDSFFRHLNGGRLPCLGHRMLQALAEVLRCGVLLTTNFDDLIEKAFSTVCWPLDVFDVPYGASLPDAELVLAQRSLVKMHGGRYGLRADGSVDEAPGIQDADNFLGYLAGRKLEPGESSRPGVFKDQVAVLVVGASGEGRIRFLLHLALRKFENLRVYWIAHGWEGEESDRRLRLALGGATAPMRGRVADRLTIVHHPYPELLLLEMYGRVTGSLPTAGVVFPSMWELPMPPLIGPTGTRVQRREFLSRVHSIRSALLDEWAKQDGKRQPVVVAMGKGWRGGVAVCSEVFWQATSSFRGAGSSSRQPPTEPRPHPLWVDLDQVGRPVGVLLRLTLLAAKANGDPDPISALDVKTFDEAVRSTGRKRKALFKSFSYRLKHILRVQFSSPQGGKRLLVFLNAQEGCGVDSPFAVPPLSLEERAGGENNPPAEHDDLLISWDSEAAVSAMLGCLGEINKDDSCGVQLVLITRTPSRRRKPPSGLGRVVEKVIQQSGLVMQSALLKAFPPASSVPWLRLAGRQPCSPFDPSRVCSKAIDWAQRSGAQRRLRFRFLFAITCFRHARLAAGFPRILRSHAPAGSEPTSRWLAELERKGALRFKPGGIIWMHPTVKVLLRDRLMRSARQQAGLTPREAAQIEFRIARWYGRLLLAAADPMAAVESVFHCLRASKSAASLAADQECVTAALNHSTQVMHLGLGLFERRLTDRFAMQALQALKTRAGWLHQVMSHQPLVPKDLIGRVDQLEALLESQIGDLRMREAELAELADPFTGRRTTCRHDTVSTLVVGDCQHRLRRAGALMLLRRFDEAADAFQTLAEGVLGVEVARRLDSKSQQGVGRVEQAADRAARTWLKAGRADCWKLFAAKLCRWMLQFAMHRGQAQYLLSRRKHARSSRTRNLRQDALRALRYYHFGAEILRHCGEVSDGQVWHENVRLRAHAALCYLVGQQSEVAAARMLDDADAFLDEFPRSEPGVARAIVHIRRAEVKLHQAASDPGFEVFRHALRRIRVLGRLGPGVRKRLPRLPEAESGQLLRVLGIVRDASCALDVAEAELELQPKSRYWWWVVTTNRMKVTEYLYCCRLWRGELRGASSKIISEIAVRCFWGRVGELVEGKQMKDPFLLSRVVWSYSQAAKAHALFHLRTRPETAWGTELAPRLRQVRRHLGHLKESLEALLHPRVTRDIDQGVRRYGQASLATARAVDLQLRTTLKQLTR